MSVVGNAGSGKSWLGLRVAQVLRVPFVELDAIHHLSGWEPIDPEEFLTRVATVAATDAWVIDGNYRLVVVEGPVWHRADTVVWLDLPRRTVMRHIALRTLRRIVRREAIWNGNRERIHTLWPGTDRHPTLASGATQSLMFALDSATNAVYYAGELPVRAYGSRGIDVPR